MIMDKQNLFSDAQAITATADSTNCISLGVARDIGMGEELYIMLVVDEAFTDSGSDSTVTVTLVTDDNAALSTKATVATLVTLPALTAAGTKLFFRLPPEVLVAYEEYVGLTYTLANGNLTTGKITAGLVKDISKFTVYETATVVS